MGYSSEGLFTQINSVWIGNLGRQVKWDKKEFKVCPFLIAVADSTPIFCSAVADSLKFFLTVGVSVLNILALSPTAVQIFKRYRRPH